MSWSRGEGLLVTEYKRGLNVPRLRDSLPPVKAVTVRTRETLRGGRVNVGNSTARMGKNEKDSKERGVREWAKKVEGVGFHPLQ